MGTCFRHDVVDVRAVQRERIGDAIAVGTRGDKVVIGLGGAQPQTAVRELQLGVDHDIAKGEGIEESGAEHFLVEGEGAVSIDYYTHEEQRRLAPSPQVLEGLCRVLRLNPEQTAFAGDLLNHARFLRPGPRTVDYSCSPSSRSCPPWS